MDRENNGEPAMFKEQQATKEFWKWKKVFSGTILHFKELEHKL